MIQFHYPELFLLAIPLWFAFRRWGRVPGATGWIRAGIVAVLLLALTGPEINVGGKGVDLLVVADRSRSMPASAHDSIRELIRNLETNRGPGDRVAVVTFGHKAQVEHVLSHETLLEEYHQEILPDGSDLYRAIDTALNLVDPNRPARIVVFSDGEANGQNPLSAARRAREAGVPIDYRLFERVRIGDAAVESVLLPETVAPREPFQFSVWVHADRDVRGTVRVLRGGREIGRQESDLHAGMNRLLFRDLIGEGGFFNYTVELDVAGDPLPENNRGAGVIRVDAGPRVLVLTGEKSAGNLVRTLEAGRLPVDVASPAEHPLTQDVLDPYRAVILENVPARELGRLKMERLAQFVEDLGGGLLMTGGQKSFGTGGYFNSPLDDVLPVSMELREEHRKTRIAIAIALDRSGSMMAPAGAGKTKMDLANLGTAECIRMLTPQDSVAVIAVDSSPHIIQELTPVADPEGICSRVRKIESMGGGIFVYEALVAAGKQLAKAEQVTKHIILFSDAADSEEPGDYKNLLKKFEDAGITVSVIGLGTTSDVDAKLLEDIAKLGRGNIMFTDDPEELPRLFSEDTMSVARSTFITKEDLKLPAIPAQLLPDARLMGELGSGVFPTIDGYNLSYLKPHATLAVVSRDEFQAPLAAFWYRGLGRVAALTLEVDGQFSGEFGRWESYADFLITHARWLMGGNHPNDVFVKVERDGQDALVTVELDPERAPLDQTRPPRLIVVPPGAERETALQPDFVWTGPHTLEARFPLERTGTYRTLVQSGDRSFTRGPAVTLPYSPEFAPRLGLPGGSELLAAMAELTGGKPRVDVLELFQDPPRSPRTVPLLPWLAALAIVVLLVEIAGRRLSLWERVWLAVEEEEATERAAGWLPKWKLHLPHRRRRAAVSSPATAAAAREALPVPPPASQQARSAASVFSQAKDRARRRMGDA